MSSTGRPTHTLDPRLAVDLAGMRLRTPLVLASGILGTTASSLRRVAMAGAGAVTAKSVSKTPRKGHPNPTVVPLPHGMLNAVGLSNPGAEAFVEELLAYQMDAPAPLIASIFAASVEEFSEVAGIVARARPDLIEVNVSCPNVHSEFGQPFGADPVACGEITAAVKQAAGTIPVAIKLTVQCPSIAAVARACEKAGADVITAINTVGPGMHIDVNLRRPELSNKVGGLSGPAILPVAVRAVYEIAAAVNIPIIGTGGVSSAEDALQLILAGARAVGLGTAVWSAGLEVFDDICCGLSAYLDAHDQNSLAGLVGAAHA
ncbi:MAG: dihydroorotate dehydrogenase [Pseudomonadota bacterium]